MEVRFLGCVPYAETFQLQKELHARILNGEGESTLLLLEHAPVITLGKHASLQNVLVPRESLEEAGIALEQVDRGGEATAHEPGQLVIYPIWDLRKTRLGPKAFVSALEDVVMDVLRIYGISGHRDAEFPGVWVGSEKICAVGIRIRQGVSYHGMALNVSNSLNTFQKIIPCGIQDRGVCTISGLLARDISLLEVAKHFAKIFSLKFEVAGTLFKD